ncbi:MAG TPA: hypothetical protein VK324_16800 [Tepidisphaeraceae bacterium]|nr:hypothetical protein [Tepidisphaeraceae bacterium]
MSVRLDLYAVAARLSAETGRPFCVGDVVAALRVCGVEQDGATGWFRGRLAVVPLALRPGEVQAAIRLERTADGLTLSTRLDPDALFAIGVPPT